MLAEEELREEKKDRRFSFFLFADPIQLIFLVGSPFGCSGGFANRVLRVRGVCGGGVDRVFLIHARFDGGFEGCSLLGQVDSLSAVRVLL